MFNRYSAFFDLFETFRGYVDFFLLQDLVDDDSGAIRTFTDWSDFSTARCQPQSRSTAHTGDEPSSSWTPANARIAEAVATKS